MNKANGFVRQWDHADSPLLWVELIYAGDMKMKPFFGFQYHGHYFRVQKQIASFYKNLASEREAIRFGATKYRSQDFFNYFSRTSKKLEKDLLAFTQYIAQTPLARKTNQEIVDFFTQFFDQYASLYAFYRFCRPEFYAQVINDIQRKFPHLKGEDFLALLNGSASRHKIDHQTVIIARGLAQIGERRFSMHKSWQVAYRRGQKLFAEIGKRLQLTSLEVQNCTSHEILRGLAREIQIDKKNIKKRIGGFQFVYHKNRFQIVIPLQDLREPEAKIKEVHGTTAFYGDRVRGRVTIVPESLTGVSRHFLNAIPQGSIFVTAMTSPDMLPGLKKVSAIVTDEGGLLCHAAVVSRELKIPCVIGTKVATKVFKDGDRVEVDAMRGIVKKI